MSFAPEAPSGWPLRDRPAVDVDLVEVGAGLLLPGEHDRGERLVDLEHVDVVDGEPGAVEHLLGRGDDPGEHEDRVVTGDGEAVDRARLGSARAPRPSSAPSRARAAAPSEICDALPAWMTHWISGKRSDISSGSGRRAEARERLDRGALADALVAVDLSPVGPRRVTSTGSSSSAKRPSSVAAAARRCDSGGERVELLARQPPLGGDQLGGDALVDQALG
jgi:hypothetical protein